MIRRVMLFLVGLGMLGCSEQPGQIAAPTIASFRGAEGGRIGAVRILPDNPTSQTTLEAEVLFRGAPVENLNYQWLRNGIPMPGAIRSTLASQYLHRGDFISVRVWVSLPGSDRTPVVSETVVVGNTPPVVGWVGVAPLPATSSVDLRALVRSKDPDDDPVSYTFKWTVNGETVVGQDGPSLTKRYFRRGDQVRVTALPFDGTDWGNAIVSPVAVIQNSPPMIVSTPPEQPEGDFYRYKLRVEDVDGDPLRFSLQGEQPPGMKIDPVTGVLEWEVVVPEQAVTYRYEVVAEDPDGARSIQKITLKYEPPESE